MALGARLRGAVHGESLIRLLRTLAALPALELCQPLLERRSLRVPFAHTLRVDDAGCYGALVNAPTLLLVDVQREYFTPGSPLLIPDGEAVLARLAGLLVAAREVGVPVIHVQHHEDASSEVFSTGTSAVETMEDVAPAQGEPLLVKHLPGCFDGTALDELLQELGTRTLVIGGFMTHLCCDTTARQAHARGYDVVFLTDGTATRDLEGPTGAIVPHQVVQEVTLAAQADGFSRLASVASVHHELRAPS